MHCSFRQRLAQVLALAVLSYTLSPAQAQAADHIVPLQELRGQASAQANERTRNLEDLTRVLALPQAQEALSKSQVDPNRVGMAMANLNDEDLSRLADRARAAEQDLEGGLIFGLLALIGLVVVILVVLAVLK